MSWAKWVATPLILVGVACGSSKGDDHPAPAGPDDGGEPTTRAGNGGSGASDSMGGETAVAGNGSSLGGEGPVDVPPPDLGDLSGGASPGGAGGVEVVDVPPSPGGDDAHLDITPVVFAPPTAEHFSFDRAGVIGDRYFALDSASLAIMTFGPDGDAPSDVGRDDPLAASGRGSDLVVLQLDAQGELLAATYDASLERGSSDVHLAGSGTGSHAVAGSADQSMALWKDNDELHGLLFDANGAIGDGFDFGPRSCGAHDCAASAVYTGERFVALWSRVNAAGDSMLSWGTIDAKGAALAGRNVLRSETPIHLEDTTPLANGRIAVLLSYGIPAKNPLLVFVDAFGALEDTVHIFQGATAGWTIAHDADSLLISARSNHSQGVIRHLDLKGEPLTDWLVVDDTGLDTAIEPRVALFSDGKDYGAVIHMTEGSSSIVGFDPSTFPKP